MRAIKGEKLDFSVLRQQLLITTLSRKASQNIQHVTAWGSWGTRAIKHTGFHSCQPRTGLWGYPGYRFTEARQMKKGKTSPGLWKTVWTCFNKAVNWFSDIKGLANDNEWSYSSYNNAELKNAWAITAVFKKNPKEQIYLSNNLR